MDQYGRMFKVIKPYIPFGKGMLSLAIGDVIIELDRDSKKGQIKGQKVRTKREGWFPIGNVQQIVST